jgi:Glycosyl hydrolases family 2, sugar binding domain/Glycosyl hydrolases family 2
MRTPGAFRDRAARMAAVCLAAFLFALVSGSAAAQERWLDAWQFLTDPSGSLAVSALPAEGWRPAVANRSWNAQFEDLRDYFGVAWYKTTVEIPPSARKGRILVRFGAVDHFADVYVNGTKVGSHEGAYTPFTVDITDTTRPGSNDLVVRVIDPPPTPPGGLPRFPEMPYEELPRGKQNWYIQNGGLWQPVTLELRPPVYIERVQVTAKTSGSLEVGVEIAGGPATRAAALKVVVRGPDGRLAATLPDTRVSAAGRIVVAGTVASPRLWSPADPTLYSAEASLAGTSPDRAVARFGFREFTARDGQFFLNGQPFYMRGALDQDFYADSIYSTPDKAFVVDMMRKGRMLGLNMLRCHIKVCDPTYLDAADEVGMLVWYEVPSWDRWTPGSVARGRRTFDDMVTRDWNHPSIVIQSLINEAWGIDMTKADQRTGLRQWFDDAKIRVAPLGRLLVDNSACCENFHLKSDIDDFHQYFSIPDNADRWDKWVADFANRPAWSYSPHGDASRTGKEPLVVSEFGNWGLPELPQTLPWWFPRDFDGRAITRPAGLFDRFKALGFSQLFPDYAALAKEAQWRQFQSLKHEIESMRRHEPIRGYVITEFTDINWEANGLMDMWRRPKTYAHELSDIQQDDVLLPVAEKTSITVGEMIRLSVSLSRYGDVDPAGGTLEFEGARVAGNKTPVKSVARGSVGHIGDVEIETIHPFISVSLPTRARIALTLKSAAGKVIAKNYQDVFVYPAAGAPVEAVLHDPHGALGALPWKPRPATASDVVVTAAFDAEMRRFVENSGKVLVVPRGVLGTFAAAPGLSAVDRRDELDGNWVSNFPWVNAKSAAFRDAAVTTITGGEASGATPRRLIAGVPDAAWAAGDVLAGNFYGWLNSSHAVVAQFRLAKGKVIVSTFDIDRYGKDLFATRVLDGLIRYLASDECAPKTELQ